MGNLFTRRAIALLLAIALAVVAAIAVFNYVRGVEDELLDERDLVEGYVATQRIEVGTLADTAIQLEQIQEAQIPRDLLTEDAITDLTQITGRVVEEVILPGDIIVSGRFAAPGQGANVLTIPPEHQAVSFDVGVPPGVAGFLREGDHVSIVATIAAPGADAPGTAAADEEGDGGQEPDVRSEYVLQDVEILAIGRRVPPSEENPAGSTDTEGSGILLTVALLPDEVEKLVFANSNGELWLTLLPEDERDPVDTDGITVEELFDE